MLEGILSNENTQQIFRAHIIAETGESQSVKKHLENVAALTSKNAKIFGLEKTGFLIGLIHDVGKYTRTFDDYLKQSVYDPLKAKRGSVNHTTAGAKLVFDSFHYQSNGVRRFLSELLTITIYSHHGIYDCLTLSGINVMAEKMRTTKEIHFEEAISNFFREIISENTLNRLFDESAAEVELIIKKIDRTEKDFNFALLERILLSCLVDADWTDTTLFMSGNNIEIVQNDSIPHWDPLCNFLDKKLTSFSCVTEIDKLRSRISDECLTAAKRRNGIYRLIVPTGGGKTLASLRFALNHAKEYNKAHVFYIIPFLSILEQNAMVIREFVGDEGAVLEHHSNVVHEVDSDDALYENERYKSLAQNWDSPIVITTMVQFLNTLFINKLQSIRRMHTMANSVIVFDEIQSLPIKMISLFNMAVNFLVEVCGATAVLCSATQPILDKVTRPIHIAEKETLTENIEESFHAFKRTELRDNTKNGGYSLSDAAMFADDLMKDVSNLLMICNTKSEAAGIYQKLKERNLVLPLSQQYKLFHLSTSMCAQHRAVVLDKIKNLKGRERLVCVSTQLIEAGVDISFECVVRVVAGLDSLIQAAGRCNRNCESDCRSVHILNIRDEKLGNLEEMKTAQQACLRLLSDYSDNSHFFDEDLMSLKAMDCFYKYYYSEIKSKMNYSLKKENTSIVDLLSSNQNGREAYYGKTGIELSGQIFKQAFKTAGENFEVIPDNTTDILVPYNDEAKNLITELNGEISFPEALKAVKKTQRLSVSLYDNLKKALMRNDALYTLKNGEIIALKEEFYDENLGVISESNNMNFLDI